MNKYDFGYELLPGTTNDWAYRQIKCGSTVLEIGSSNGNLIFHLTKEKNCIADIVEYNEEAGIQASQFARTALIGEINGDVEREEWQKALEGNVYDYIIVLDVLEHLHRPFDLLVKLKQLLKEEGMLLLSIPNISHNSVVINLLNDKFEYTETGLLDDTHVHFFTYQSAKQMLINTGFHSVFEEVKQVDVGQTELCVQYEDVPRNVAAFLKTRRMGNAYQFLFCAKKKAAAEPVCLQYQEPLPYESVVFQDDQLVARKNINPLKKQSICVDFKEGTTAIRIDPLNRACIIRNWDVFGYDFDGEKVELESLVTTGNTVGDTTIFYDDDPQIYVVWQQKIVKMVFNCQFVSFDDAGLIEAGGMRDYVRTLEQDVHSMQTLHCDQQQEIVNLNARLEEEHQLFTQEQEKYRTLQTLHDDQQQEIINLKARLEEEHQLLTQEQEKYCTLQKLLREWKIFKAIRAASDLES